MKMNKILLYIFVESRNIGIPTGVKHFFFLQNFQTGSRANPVSHSVGNW